MAGRSCVIIRLQISGTTLFLDERGTFGGGAAMSGISEMSGNTFPEREEESRTFHLQPAGDAVDMWIEGVNLCLSGFDLLRGQSGVQIEDRVRVGLLISAWQNAMCGMDLALRGYYPQSLNLMRAPWGYVISYWYLVNYPARYRRFIDPNMKTPRLRSMAEDLAKKHGEQLVAPVRKIVSDLSDFSHPDRYPMTMSMEIGQVTTNYALGPATDEAYFRTCADQGVSAVIFLAAGVDNLRLSMGHPGLPDFQDWIERADQWKAENGKRATQSRNNQGTTT
jgi:hypothetical protein